MQMTRHTHMIPHFKILRHFISELMRAHEYQTYITDYHKLLIKHVKQYGEHSNHNVTFNLHDVYEDLISFSVPEIPSSLTPSPNVLTQTLPPTSKLNTSLDMNLTQIPVQQL